MVERRGKLIGRGVIGRQISVAAGEQIAALARFHALHQGEHCGDLTAHRERMQHPLVVALIPGAEPKRRSDDQGRERSRDDEAPIERGKRLRVGHAERARSACFTGTLRGIGWRLIRAVGPHA